MLCLLAKHIPVNVVPLLPPSPTIIKPVRGTFVLVVTSISTVYGLILRIKNLLMSSQGYTCAVEDSVVYVSIRVHMDVYIA